MRNTIFLLFAIGLCMALIGCGIPLVTHNAAEVQQEKYLYSKKHYPSTTVSQLQMQLSAYKTRCGLLPFLEHSMNFEKISENEHALFVQGSDGINIVIRAKDEDGVYVKTWARSPRLAAYMTNAIENGQCKSSVWE